MSMMRSKQDFIDKLRNSDMFKVALEQAESQEAKDAIVSHAEAFVSSIADALVPIFAAVEKDPNVLWQKSEPTTVLSGSTKDNK